MKRWVLMGLGFVLFVMLLAPMVGQVLYADDDDDDDDEDELKFYVLAEKRGPDVTCRKLTSYQDVKERTTELKRERAETLKQNAALKKEVRGLKRKVVALKQLKGRKTTEADKQEVQQRIDKAEQELKDKEGQIKEPVQVVVKGPFKKSADADALIDRIEAEARRAKLKAEKTR